MKTIKKYPILILLILFITSCKKNDDANSVAPDYVKGKWTSNVSYKFNSPEYQNIVEHWYFGEDGVVIYDGTAWDSYNNRQQSYQFIGTYAAFETSVSVYWNENKLYYRWDNGSWVTTWFSPNNYVFTIQELNNRTMILSSSLGTWTFTRVIE